MGVGIQGPRKGPRELQVRNFWLECPPPGIPTVPWILCIGFEQDTPLAHPRAQRGWEVRPRRPAGLEWGRWQCQAAPPALMLCHSKAGPLNPTHDVTLDSKRWEGDCRPENGLHFPAASSAPHPSQQALAHCKLLTSPVPVFKGILTCPSILGWRVGFPWEWNSWGTDEAVQFLGPGIGLSLFLPVSWHRPQLCGANS